MSSSGKKTDESDSGSHDVDPWNSEPARTDAPTELDRAPLPDSELTQIPDTPRYIGGWMIIILWVMALLMATFVAQSWMDNRDGSRQGTLVSDEQGRQALLLRANRYGQYRVNGSTNGQEVIYLVDTGASSISIPDSVARTLGLRRGRAYDVNTANGVVTVYATRLQSLSIGHLQRRDVEAHINPGMEGDMALLGMSFLRDFEIIHRDGEMIIREP